jgi:glycosyltransferase involved in cell wall biosynthesis
MRIVIHDFVGHAFPAQLSRALAARGHFVLHLYFPGFEAPKGKLSISDSDPVTLSIEGVTLGSNYRKYSPLQRLLSDRQYISKCVERILQFKPDVVLSGNATPVAENLLRSACQSSGIAFVAWIQDLYGIGAKSVLGRKYGWFGEMAGSALACIEKVLIQKSDAVVFIAQEFRELFGSGRPSSRASWHVIENWAPIEDLPERPKVNPWSIQHGLDRKKVILYSGTLGLKHNPELLVSLALEFKKDPEAAIVVISQGLGRRHLEGRRKQLRLDNLYLFDFQPFSVLPEVIGAGDVLLAVIEKEAGIFSIPSKVLTYLCAARPLLLSVPATNLAARIVSKNRTGVVVEPNDIGGLIREAKALLQDSEYAAGFATRARDYSLRTFDIVDIAARFEKVFAESIRFALAKRASLK